MLNLIVKILRDVSDGVKIASDEVSDEILKEIVKGVEAAGLIDGDSLTAKGAGFLKALSNKDVFLSITDEIAYYGGIFELGVAANRAEALRQMIEGG